VRDLSSLFCFFWGKGLLRRSDGERTNNDDQTHFTYIGLLLAPFVLVFLVHSFPNYTYTFTQTHT
jgi:hypothetical protein